jgi:hypothetical protein
MGTADRGGDGKTAIAAVELPVPATVIIVPLGITIRMQLLPPSAM